MKKTLFGFTLIELLVVISIISLLSGVIYANFTAARENSRDKVRKTSLKELALALEVYKSQNGTYPGAGCGASPGDWATPSPTCSEYIAGLVPEFIPELPVDPNQDSVSGLGFMYQVSSSGDRYKVIVKDTVESDLVNSFDNPFARCPSASGGPCSSGAPERTYAVYSPGTEDW
jgi:prepilin-type N-terminal cleavage/methylation domain-containing protein